MTNHTPITELTDEQVEQILFDAMRFHGMLPPSVEEVAAIDADLASFELPFSPSDPNELLKQLDSENTVKVATILSFTPLDSPSLQNLARAARNGNELTTEIEQRMAADKAKYLQEENYDR